jgi:hypothetical protein
VSNEAVQWGDPSRDGWEVTPPASPIDEAWPGAVADEHCGVWPSLSKVVPTCANGCVTTRLVVVWNILNNRDRFERCLVRG